MELVYFHVGFVLFSLYNIFGTCLAQLRSTTSGCVVNSCSYARDTRAMDCEGRLLTCIPSNSLYKQSEYIKLAQNLIPMIRRTSFSGYTRLVQLDISNNAITTLDPYAFHSVTTLQALFINFNQLTQIEATPFSNLRNLRILQIQGNNINRVHRNAFKELVGIRELNLAGNRLTELPDGVFSAMSSMQTLFLQENQLVSSVDSQFLRGLRGLQDIDLDGNRFSAIPVLDDLSRLTSLDITDSHVTMVSNNTFRNAVRLRDIVLTGNLISSVEPLAFVGLQNAVELDLSSNALINIPVEAFSPLGKLEILLLQNNGMTELRSEHFNTLTSLRTLNLEGNKLTRLPLMPALQSLRVFNAKANLLETFDKHTLRSIPRVRKLQLAGNRLQCDCRLIALKQWFISSGPTHHPHEIPLCNAAQPRALRGTRITSLSQGNLVCEPPTVISGLRTFQSMEGSRIVLSCVSSGFPIPEITWMTPEGFVYTSGYTGRIAVTENGDLTFRTVEVLDQGEYTCLGTNPAGVASATVTLRVTHNPNVLTKSPPIVPDNTSTRIPITILAPRDSMTTRKPPVKGTTRTQYLGAPTEQFSSNSVPAADVITVKIDPISDIDKLSPVCNDDIGGSKTFHHSPVLVTTESTKAKNGDPPPVCINGHSGVGLFGAILCTFFLTLACVIVVFFAWQRGLIPTRSNFINRKRRLVSVIRRRESSRVLTPSTPPSGSSTPRRVIHPPSYLRSGIQSYSMTDGVSLGSSYSFSEVSTAGVSVSSKEDTARYVTTERVTGPSDTSKHERRVAAITCTSLTDSEISSASSCSSSIPSDKRVYANAAVVNQDPNYTSLWIQTRVPPSPTNENYETQSARNVDSRIYIDVR